MTCRETCPQLPYGNNTLSHCGGCHETFSGLGAFDAHFERQEDGSVVCIELVADETSWWVDDRNVWHKGRRLTQEEKDKIWGKLAKKTDPTPASG